MEEDRYSDELWKSINWNYAVYAIEKLSGAISCLVEGEGDVRSRLREGGRHLKKIPSDYLPEYGNLRQRYMGVIAKLTKFPVQYRDNVPYSQTPYDETLRNIRNRTGAKIAGELYGIFLEFRDVFDAYHGIEKKIVP